MMVKGHLRKCLIILTRDEEKAFKYFKYILHKGKLLKISRSKIAAFMDIKEELSVYIFHRGKIKKCLEEITNGIDLENKIKDLLKKIYNYFFDVKTSYSISGDETNKKFDLATEINEYDKVIICGHLHLPLNTIKKIYNEIMSELPQETGNYQYLKKLEDMINGKGKIILTSYTIGGDKTASDHLIESLESSQNDSNTEKIYIELFDSLWNTNKIKQHTNKIKQLCSELEALKTHNFFSFHNKKHFGDNKADIKNKIEKIEKEISSVKSFKDRIEKLGFNKSLIEKFKKGPPKNEKESKDIYTELCKIVEAILDSTINYNEKDKH